MEPVILSAIVVGLIEVCKRVGLPNNFVYPLALVFGVGAFLLGGESASWGDTILNGLIVGLTATGLYEGGKKLPIVSNLLTRGK